MVMSRLDSLRSTLTIGVGKAARLAARLKGHGSGGTALPGLVMEKIDPAFLARTLNQLPHGVVVISGTNGKTTTTKMVVELLRSQGLRVVTNRTGSNFVRGVLASLLTEVSWKGQLDADVAVLELDEAHAVRFVELVKPRVSLFLNVMRDQLDRFGEIDYTASLLHRVALATTGTVVVNADDPRLASPRFTSSVTARLRCFGAGEQLRDLFLSDDDLREGRSRNVEAHESCGDLPPASVVLEAVEGDHSKLRIEGESVDVDFAIPGIHNRLNACAALLTALEVIGPDASRAAIIEELSHIEAAFGRGEVVWVGDNRLEITLVKNPAGFRMGLLTAEAAINAYGPESVMIAINDDYADGRDMSWLWDVDFRALAPVDVAVVTGVRAFDMALRLSYDGVTIGEVNPDLEQALKTFLTAARDAKPQRMRIFTTYTAMLTLRRHLAQYTTVEEVMG